MGFNPEDYCDESEAINPLKNPIKALICVVINFIKLIAPLTEYIFILIDFFVSILMDNKDLLELIIIMSPSIPIFYLFMYLFDSI